MRYKTFPFVLAAVLAADPTPQTQIVAGAASVTFSAPSGGAAPYSYSATLIKPDSSTESLGDQGVGPYNFTTTTTGVYQVQLAITDSRGVPTQATGVVSLVKDYLPPAAPTRQDLATGTTSGTVDFGAATGQTTPGTPTVTLDKPVGSSASASVAAQGGGWRVSLSNLANGGGYRVILTYTASDGQVCYQSAVVTVAAAAASGNWEIAYTWDFTDCTAKDISAEGTHNVFKADGTTPLVDVVRSHTGTTAATFVGNFVPEVGLVMSQSVLVTDARNATAALDLAIGGGLNMARNMYYIELLCVGCALEATNSATLNLSLQAQSDGAGQPAFGLRFDRSGGVARKAIRKRFSGTATNEGITNVATPATFNVGFWIAAGHQTRLYQGTSTSYQGPSSRPSDYVATSYGDAQAGSATDADNWAAEYLVYSATNQALAGGPTTLTIVGARAYVKPLEE